MGDMKMTWAETPWGYFASNGKHLYSITRYRAGKQLDEFRWVLRIDGSAEQSPAEATSLKEAKRRAEEHANG